MNPTEKYKKNLEKHLSVTEHDRATTTRFAKWLLEKGLDRFEASFKHETGKKVSTPGEGTLVEQAYADGMNDVRKKLSQDSFYVSNARIFLTVAEAVATGIVQANKDKRAELFASRHFAVLKGLALDSRVLLQDWATFKLKVPGVYGIGKNPHQHPLQIAHAARQLMFAGSPFFAFEDNAMDAATALVRVAIETRLRFGFGLIAVEDLTSGASSPLMLSKVLAAIGAHVTKVSLSIPLQHVARLYGWSNSYIHTGARSYMWSPIFALDYLRPLLTGGAYSGGFSVNAGIQLDKAALSSIHREVEALLGLDPLKEQLIRLPANACNAIVRP